MRATFDVIQASTVAMVGPEQLSAFPGLAGTAEGRETVSVSRIARVDAHRQGMSTRAPTEAITIQACGAPFLNRPSAVALLRILRAAASDERQEASNAGAPLVGHTQRVASRE